MTSSLLRSISLLTHSAQSSQLSQTFNAVCNSSIEEAPVKLIADRISESETRLQIQTITLTQFL